MLHRPIESTPRALTTLESDQITLTSEMTDETDVLTVIGPLPGVSVWFQGPTAWAGAAKVIVRLYARVGGVRVELTSAHLANVLKRSEGDGLHALVLSCQGIGAEAYEVTVQRSGGGETTLHSGRFILFASKTVAPLAVLGEGGIAAGQSVRLAEDKRAAYAACAEVDSGTSTGTRILMHLWHPWSATTRYEVRRVVISYFGGASNARLTLRGTRIDASTATGSALTPEKFDLSDPYSTASVRKNPTSSSSTSSSGDVFLVSVSTAETGIFVWEASDRGRPFVLPANQDGGLEIRSELHATVAAATPISIALEWIEI